MGNYSQIGVTRLREAYRGLREEVGYLGGTGLMICSFAFLVFAEERPHPIFFTVIPYNSKNPLRRNSCGNSSPL